MTIELKDGNYPLVFDYAGFRKRFSNGDEVRSFLKSETDAWNQLEALQPSPPRNRVFVSAAGKQAIQRANNDFGGGTATEASAALRRLETESAIIHASTQGETLRKVAEHQPNMAAAAAFVLASANGKPLPNGNLQSQQVTLQDLSAVIGATVLSTTDAKTAPTKRQLEALVEDSRSLLQSAEKNVDDFNMRSKASLDAAEDQRIATKETIDGAVEQAHVAVAELQDQISKRLDAHFGSATSEIDEFKKKVRIDVSLAAPSQFWKDKANGHRNWAIGSALVFTAIVLVGIWWLDNGALDLLAKAKAAILGTAATTNEQGLLNFVPLAFVTIPALGVAWVLRHVSRVLIQNLSLEADARLRQTITTTFQALAADRAMNEAELAIALQALFRPIDGKDHTDIAPPTLGELLRMASKE